MADIERYTCHHCGKTYNRRKGYYRKCSCQQGRMCNPWPDDYADGINEEQCIKIADHERMRIRNEPISDSDAESLLGFDALYEDDAAWNRRSRKCTANGVPPECAKRNPQGLWHGMPVKLKEYAVDPADFEYHPPSKTCRKCAEDLRNRHAEGDPSLCMYCARKMGRVVKRQTKTKGEVNGNKLP